MHPICCVPCCHSILELYASVDECFQAMEAMRQHMEDLQRVVKDDYKFLNQNMRKRFGMVGNMRESGAIVAESTTRICNVWSKTTTSS
jgi:hypothetical protein